MKNHTAKIYGWLAVAGLLALSVRADNSCMEGGPHYSDWNCLQAPAVSSATYITPTSINVSVGQTIPQPQVYNLILTNGVSYRSVTYDCSVELNHLEFQNQANTAGSLYFVPPIPSTIQTPGTYTYSGNIDVTSSDGACPTTFMVGMITVHVANNFFDVDFGSGASSLKTGYAAVGASTNDFWNEAGLNNVANLKSVDGSVSSVGLVVSYMVGVSNNGSPDPMFNDYVYGSSTLPVGQSVTVTLTNLPTGSWNVYLYASDGSFDLNAGGTDYGTQTCFDRFPANRPIWRQGVHYALYSNVTVTNGQNVTIKVQPGISGCAMISGLQITTGCSPALLGLPPIPGLIAWWRAESNALDSIGTNNGTLMGGGSYAAGEVGHAFSLDGSSGYVQVPDNDLWAFGANDFSIELWANSRALPQGDIGHANGGVFISNDEGAFDVNKWWFALGGGVLNFLIDTPAQGSVWLVQAPFTPATNQWYHVAIVRSGNLYTIYTNGMVAGSQTNSRVIPNPNAPLMIGQAEGFFFNGLLDEVSVYNRALSSDEIATIYNVGAGGKVEFQNIDSDYDGRSDVHEAADQTDPNNPDDFLHIQLGHWRFDDTNTWIGDQGQLPLSCTNVVGVPSWDTNAVLIDSMNVAYLKYHEVDTNGANINLRRGTIRFWFKPDWSGVSAGGIGPQDQGRLIEIASQGTNTGWWILMLDTNGNTLSFITQTNGVGMTNLTTGIIWSSNIWHQVALTYSASRSSLYVDGQAVVTNGLGSQYWPNATERSAGFRIGSDATGNNQARGVFDELDTFNYPLDAASILANFQAAWDLDSDGDGLSNILENELGTNPYGVNSSYGLSSTHGLSVFTPLK